jgi:hypothetical protein
MTTKSDFFLCFFAYYFLKLHLHYFSNIKKGIKKSQNSKNQGFPYYFCLIEGSGAKSLSGTVHRTNGFGSRRLKNTWIRIRNTGRNLGFAYYFCWMIKRSGSESASGALHRTIGSGSPNTNGSGTATLHGTHIKISEA